MQNNSFVPKYDEKTPLKRKLLEFHNAELSTTFDTITNVSLDIQTMNNKRKTSIIDIQSEYSTFNPRERRIKELYPNMNKEEIEKVALNNLNYTFDDNLNVSQFEPKKACVSDKYSNIFNDPV